jgi:hypothetical protein
MEQAAATTGSSATSLGTILRRVARVFRLDRKVYAEIEADPHGVRQGALVVAVVAAAAVLGTLFSDDWHAGAILGAVAAALIHWLLWSGLLYLAATVLFKAPARMGAVLSGLGYAQAPQIIVALGFIPFLGIVLVLVSRVLSFLAGHHAMRATLKVEKRWQVMASTLVSFLITFAIAGVVRAVLGDVHLLDGLTRP